MKPKKILVCGDRYWTDKDTIRRVLEVLNPEVVIHGAAKGADSLAGEVANDLNIATEVYPAQWSLYGKGAGPIRNQQMIDEGHPDIVIWFHKDLDSSKGTRNMIDKALDCEIAVYNGEEIDENFQPQVFASHGAMEEMYNGPLGQKIKDLEKRVSIREGQLQAELTRHWEMCADSRKGFKYVMGSNYKLFMNRSGTRFPLDPKKQEVIEDFVPGNSEITEVQPLDNNIVFYDSTVQGVMAVVISILGTEEFGPQEDHEEIVAATIDYELSVQKVFRPIEEIEKALDVAVALEILIRIEG